MDSAKVLAAMKIVSAGLSLLRQLGVSIGSLHDMVDQSEDGEISEADLALIMVRAQDSVDNI